MAITSVDDLLAAQRQDAQLSKLVARTTVANTWFSLFDIAGQPGAGTLAGTSTTTGVVPTDATGGCPGITDFAGGASGYLARVDFVNTVSCYMRLYDLLWKGGAYAFNASTSGNTPTSYSSRIPGGNYAGTEIWLEQVTAGTGVQNVNVTYINEAGTTGQSTGTIATAANTLGRLHKLPLQAGDKGVQGVTGVVGSVATAGTFNILVMRELWSGRVATANVADVHDLFRTGMPQIFQDSALFLAMRADSTSSGAPEVYFTVASK